MINVLVPLADGFEEIEAVTIIDILRRAGANVITAGLTKRNVEGSHGIRVIADSVIEEEKNKDWDLVVLPGGVPGAPALAEDKRILSLMKNTYNNGQLTGAICAAPYVLDQAGIIKEHNITSHPAWKDKISSGLHTGKRVQTDGKIITGQSAGTAMEFAFKLVEILFGKEKVEEVNQGVIALL